MDKKIIDRTRHISSNRQSLLYLPCVTLTLELGSGCCRWSPSNYNKYVCQVILNSFDKLHTRLSVTFSCPVYIDRVRKCDGRTDERRKRRTEPISISPCFSSKRRRTKLVDFIWYCVRIYCVKTYLIYSFYNKFYYTTIPTAELFKKCILTFVRNAWLLPSMWM
jgi:hypothetical protein